MMMKRRRLSRGSDCQTGSLVVDDHHHHKVVVQPPPSAEEEPKELSRKRQAFIIPVVASGSCSCLRGMRPLLVFIVTFIYLVHHVTVERNLSVILQDPIARRAGLQHSANTKVYSTTTKPPSRSDVSRNSTVLTLLDRALATEADGNFSSSSFVNSLPYVSYDDPSFEVIKDRMDAGNYTAGQHLLDFGILGFPKCGTTTMMHWLGGGGQGHSHAQLAVIQQEIMALQRNHPARILRFIMRELPEGRLLRGYKSPNDIEDQRALNKLALHYPKTKLIIGIRHPVLWFESFYNHRIQNGFDDMPPVPNMTQHCFNGYHGVCFHRSAYHMNLLKLGKTALGSGGSITGYGEVEDGAADQELQVFSIKEQKALRKEFLPRSADQVVPNPVFLYDTAQLEDSMKNEVAVMTEDTFRVALHDFLGLSPDQPLPPMVRSKPGKILNATEQSRRDQLKVDICDSRYNTQRQWLLDNGQRSAKWIMEYFIPHPEVTVADPEGLRQILDSYAVDPCVDRRKEQREQATKDA